MSGTAPQNNFRLRLLSGRIIYDLTRSVVRTADELKSLWFRLRRLMDRIMSEQNESGGGTP